MPFVPILIPSDTVIVLKLMALPPALLIPVVACDASSPKCILQGVKSLGEPATPICGFLKSSS